MSIKKQLDALAGEGAQSGSTNYILRLFVTGATPHSMLAVKNLKAICEQYLAGSCSLEIIDIYQQPERVELEQIIAAPTLIKIKPGPVRRLIGDLSDTPRVLAALGLVPRL